jgi:cell division protein FtsI/penicillin-binding protein 2
MSPVRKRALLIFSFLALGLTGISLRLVDLQVWEHEKYEKLAVANHSLRLWLEPRRGAIVDRNFQVLAQSRPTYEVHLDMRNVMDPEQTLEALAKLIGRSPRALAGQVRSLGRYELLSKDLSEEKVAQLLAFQRQCLQQWRARQKAPSPFLIVEERYQRVYPNGSLASHLVGMVDETGRGVIGVEKAWEKWLAGTPGEKWIEKDVMGREIGVFRRKDVPAVDGATVVLSLDCGVQRALEDGLRALEEHHHPNACFAIALRPKTGEILGLANRPAFDPSGRKAIDPSSLRNRCLTDALEPGSIFKIVTLSAALNERLFSLDSSLDCENGQFFYAGYWLHDVHPYGVLTLRQITAKSSNIGFAKVGLALGEHRLYRYVRLFGFGEPTGLLPGQGESPGIVRPLEEWSKLTVTRVAMGQGIAVTPIQMAMAMATIANGGWLMRPLLVKEIRDAQGELIARFPPTPVRRVISERAARLASSALKGVVEPGGTGVKAEVAGFTVAGKTGTAQKVYHGAYAHGKYLSSFIGYLPEEDPQILLLVMVDEPHGEDYYGGAVAAPAFSQMATQIAAILNIVPKSLPAKLAVEVER